MGLEHGLEVGAEMGPEEGEGLGDGHGVEVETDVPARAGYDAELGRDAREQEVVEVAERLGDGDDAVVLAVREEGWCGGAEVVGRGRVAEAVDVGGVGDVEAHEARLGRVRLGRLPKVPRPEDLAAVAPEVRQRGLAADGDRAAHGQTLAGAAAREDEREEPAAPDAEKAERRSVDAVVLRGSPQPVELAPEVVVRRGPLRDSMRQDRDRAIAESRL